MLEFLLQLLGEFLLQVVGEALVELGLHSLAEPFRQPPNPWLAALGYMIFGAVLGGLSLLVLGHHLTPAGPLRWLNLLFTPVAVGALMAAMGAWRARRGGAAAAHQPFLLRFPVRAVLGAGALFLRPLNAFCSPSCGALERFGYRFVIPGGFWVEKHVGCGHHRGTITSGANR
ncbi:hypothetical protein V8Z74_08425 [Comamonas sp. w2-DMI]|uniref:hypothetical protein n=1 Tax=Comamonas sp. w2-DMI TaxID=3126391 RepID=UPI0032E49F39